MRAAGASLLLAACGAAGDDETGGSVVVTLDAELPSQEERPLGGIEFVADFASDDIFTVAPVELALDADQPVSVPLAPAAWTATATAWTLGDVIERDGSRNRIGSAGSCSRDFTLAPGEQVELHVTFRLGEPCSIER
jgi:hypothetical protein